jgi:hypothetical protein
VLRKIWPRVSTWSVETRGLVVSFADLGRDYRSWRRRKE